MLILEGKCSITVGESNLLFEAGPFCYFGYELLDRIVHDIDYRRHSGGTQVDKITAACTTTLPSAAPLTVKPSMPSQVSHGRPFGPIVINV